MTANNGFADSYKDCLATGDCVFSDWGFGNNRMMVLIVLESFLNEMTPRDITELYHQLKMQAIMNKIRTKNIGVILSSGKDSDGNLSADQLLKFSK